MTYLLRKILSKLFIAVFVAMLGMPVLAATNITTSDIGDYGSWATEHNLETFTGQMSQDIKAFQGDFQKQLVADYVPIEARVGLAFMNALSRVGTILDNSLIRFVEIFIIIAFLFWVMLEAYNMMTGKSQARQLVEDIFKKAFMIIIWIAVLEQGPAQIFMWVMGPIISIGTALSDMILNAVAHSAGASLPDTCAAIHAYAAAHISQNMLIDAGAAADMLCVPTRLSGFFYTAVAAGWQWMLAGIGHSAFTFLVGVVFIVLFIYNAWKFALMALGVIADLFLAVLLLPFTAIAETTAKTSYKGIAGNIFNGFLSLFKVESLQTQIQRFIDAAIYFVSLSIVIALCAALLSGTVDANLAAAVPSLDNNGFMITLLTGALVAYLANRSGEIAQNLGGKVNSAFGDQVGKDISTLWNKSYGTAKEWWKIIRDEKKK